VCPTERILKHVECLIGRLVGSSVGSICWKGNLRLIGLVGLGPASRVFTFHLLDSLNQYINMPPYDLIFQQHWLKHCLTCVMRPTDVYFEACTFGRGSGREVGSLVSSLVGRLVETLVVSIRNIKMQVQVL